MIAIIDYGLGNIRAFANIYKRLNIPFVIAKSNKDLSKATKIILPGVGTFDHALELLNISGMRNTLSELVLDKKLPVLGICVGMQIFASSSQEGMMHGLGWIDGEVRKLDTTKLNHVPFLPHMGWNNIDIINDNCLFHDIENNSRFYFLHSYYFKCHNEKNIMAISNYGMHFTCAINSENIYGIQFHPEKSHSSGIQILENFWKL